MRKIKEMSASELIALLTDVQKDELTECCGVTM